MAGILGLGMVSLAYLRSDLESPPTSYLLRDRHGAFLGEVAVDPEQGYGYWPVEEIPARVVAATLAMEDRRFWEHPGVDPVAIGRALVQNVSSGERISGASTLAMQVARLQRPGPRTYPRKALEAITALWLTARHGREEVLRQYLRLVPYGHQIHGIGYAARRYLDKPVADLSWAEVAFLAAIPQAPSHMSPFDPRGRARAAVRGLRILDLLRDDGIVSDEEWQVATRQIVRLRIPPRGQRPASALHAILRLRHDLTAEVEHGPELPHLLHTSLDLDLQDRVAWTVGRRLEAWRHRNAGQAAVLVLAHDGQGWTVRAAVGSGAWDDAEHAGAIDYLRVPRSSGSTLKPFFFALAMDRGLLHPTRVLDDLERGAGGIVNADGRFLGPMLPRFALGNSRNVPAADLLAELGVEEGWATLGDLGLHDGLRDPTRYGLGLTLGSLEVTVENLARAYTALAGDGRVHEPSWWRDRPSAVGRRVITEESARQVALFLSDPQARLPSFPRMGHLEYPYPVAVKTGTSSRRRDAWAVAWSDVSAGGGSARGGVRGYLVAAWVGHPDQRPMHQLTGYTAAARLVREVMDHLHPAAEQGFGDHGFPPPRGHRMVRVCALSGGRAGTACDRVTGEWLPPSAADALGTCRMHRYVAVDRRDGLLASHRTPRVEVELRAVVDLPPRYRHWAAAAGLPLAPERTSPLGIATLAGPVAPVAALTTALATATPGPRPEPPVASSIHVVSPVDDQFLLIDPETPPSLSTLELRAVVTGRTPAQVLWYVDGEPWKLVEGIEPVRWPLETGEHRFQAEIPGSGVRSQIVRVRVE